MSTSILAAGNAPSVSELKARPAGERPDEGPKGGRSNKSSNAKDNTPSDGGGGGGGNRPPVQRRLGPEEFREALTHRMEVVKRNLIIVAVFSFVINVLVLAVPIYLFNISDRVLTSRSLDTLIMLSVVVVGAILTNVLLDAIRRIILTRTAVELETSLGGPILGAASKAAQSGSISEFQAIADLQLVRNFITGPVLLMMFDAPVGPIYLAAVFLIHPDLGFIVTGTGLVLLLVALVNQKMTAKHFALANVFSSRANLHAEAMSRNAQVINAMGMIPEGVAMWGRETAESLKAQIIAQDRNVILSTISKFTRMSTQIAILGWGAMLSLNGQLTGGMVIAGSIIGSRALGPIEGTIEGWRSLVQARAGYARIKSLLNSSPLNHDRLRLPQPTGQLSVERVLYVPQTTKKVILNGVSFQLNPGDALAVVGASGVGKSTLGRMIVGSIAPTAGNVRLDLMDLRNWDTRQFGECVGYLPQDVQLFPASIKANIARMRQDATDELVYDAAELADLHEVIAEFPQGYETVIGIDGSPLSGGQKQRIGLARAFYGNPKFVVLDEPNANLDSAGELALGRALDRARHRKITVVAITQRPSLLANVDKILVLGNGTVQAFGPRDEIMPMLQGGKRG